MTVSITFVLSPAMTPICERGSCPARNVKEFSRPPSVWRPRVYDGLPCFVLDKERDVPAVAQPLRTSRSPSEVLRISYTAYEYRTQSIWLNGDLRKYLCRAAPRISTSPMGIVPILLVGQFSIILFLRRSVRGVDEEDEAGGREQRINLFGDSPENNRGRDYREERVDYERGPKTLRDFRSA